MTNVEPKSQEPVPQSKIFVWEILEVLKGGGGG